MCICACVFVRVLALASFDGDLALTGIMAQEPTAARAEGGHAGLTHAGAR